MDTNCREKEITATNPSSYCDTNTNHIDYGNRTMTTVESKDSGISESTDDKEYQKPSFDSYTGEKYWQMRFEQLKIDYEHILKINQKLEDKLLSVVETFSKKKDELIATVEYEKSTLMADVNKLSTKLVDARIKLHDYEEKEILHAAECDSPCHRGLSSQSGSEVPILTAIRSSEQQTDSSNSKNELSRPAPRTTPMLQQQMMDDPNLV